MNTVIHTGNLTDDPTLRFTSGGTPVVNFTVAVNRKYKDRNGQEVEEPTVFVDCVAWRDMAENIAESFRKGDRALVVGRVKDASYVNKEGVNVRRQEVEVAECGPSLRWARASVVKDRSGGGGQASTAVPAMSADVPF